MENNYIIKLLTFYKKIEKKFSSVLERDITFSELEKFKNFLKKFFLKIQLKITLFQ